MRFSCAPQERGGHTNKGNKNAPSIGNEAAAQHGQRPVAEWRQRQLQTLVRPPVPTHFTQYKQSLPGPLLAQSMAHRQ
jgi:hypothetical protein